MNKQTLPFESRGRVHSDWIDFNGHMNGGYYAVAFDHASIAFLEHIGINSTYRARTHCSTFALEGHICYFAELRENESFSVKTYLFDADSKRLHLFHEMLNHDAHRVASMEVVTMHVNLNQRKSCPFPGGIKRCIDLILEQHRHYDFTLAGRRTGLVK